MAPGIRKPSSGRKNRLSSANNTSFASVKLLFYGVARPWNVDFKIRLFDLALDRSGRRF